MGYVFGIVAASVVYGLASIATSLSQKVVKLPLFVAGSAVTALVFGLISLAVAWLPFSIAVHVLRRTPLAAWLARLIASLVAAMSIAPAFIVLDHMLMLAPLDKEPDVDRIPNLVVTAFREALDPGWIVRDMPALAPWMIGYAIVAWLVYHAVVRRGEPRAPKVDGVFA